jgi:hypothetical protein
MSLQKSQTTIQTFLPAAGDVGSSHSFGFEEVVLEEQFEIGDVIGVGSFEAGMRGGEADEVSAGARRGIAARETGGHGGFGGWHGGDSTRMISGGLNWVRRWSFVEEETENYGGRFRKGSR